MYFKSNSDTVFMLPMMKTGLHTRAHTQTRTHTRTTYSLKIFNSFFLFLVPNNWLVISAGFCSTELWNLCVYAINKKICWNVRKKITKRLVFIKHFIRLLRRYRRHWKNWLFKIISSFSQEENSGKTNSLHSVNPQFGVWGA